MSYYLLVLPVKENALETRTIKLMYNYLSRYQSNSIEISTVLE